MATQADVRRICLSLPETEEERGRFAFSVRNRDKRKGFAWVWLERIDPKKPRVPNNAVLAVRVSSLVDKDLRISAEPTRFFTEPHYNGYPAILVRLAGLRVPELRKLLTEAWRCQAPKEIVRRVAGESAASPKTAKARSPRTRSR